jgi:hypothetical protein
MQPAKKSASHSVVRLNHMQAQACFAQKLWELRAQLPGKSVHWIGNSRLLGVLDVQTSQAGLLKDIHRADAENGYLALLPAAAGAIPQDFAVSTVHSLLWSYAQWTPEATLHLPERFYTDPLTLRRQPRVPAAQVTWRQVAIASLLGREPMVFDELRARIGGDADELSRDLCAFYFTRCIATVPRTKTGWRMPSIKRVVDVARSSFFGAPADSE